MQASVVKALTELLEQERQKATAAIKESGKKGHKRKLSGDQLAAGAPERKRKASGTSKTKSKLAEVNADGKEKGSPGSQGAKEKSKSEPGSQVESGEQNDAKNKKEKKKSSKSK